MGELEVLIDQRRRGDARRLARIRYATKHKVAKKPLAPVEAWSHTTKDENGRVVRWWKWTGVQTERFFAGELYTSAELRAAGFKLPKLKPKAKVGRAKGRKVK